jgi:DUF4097 and DUF4098 domain-containing protein YvlB
MPTRDKILIAVVIIISLGILAANHDGVIAAGSSEGGFDRSFNVNGAVNLSLENGSGSVNIHRGVTDKVEIHAKVRATNWFSGSDDEIQKIEQNPPVEQRGNTIRIYRPEPRDSFNHVSIAYDISVPEQTTVNSSTGSGSQTVDGVKGPVEARSGSGSVNLSNIGSEVKARTGSGHIRLDHINGKADVETGSGGVTADSVAGGSRLRTGSGGIDFSQTAPGDIDAETGSGHIKLEGVEGSVRAQAGSGSIHVDGKPKGEWEFHSGSGGIDVRTSGDVGLDLYARTSSGHVDVDPPMTIESSRLNNREVRGKIRGGGVSLQATTGSGSIHIQ